jgi:hypothetical protein
MQHFLPGRRLLTLGLFLSPLAWATTPASSELPVFQPGLWQYERTVLTVADPKPQKSSLKKCGDPTTEMKKKLYDLKQKGCQFSAVMTRGNQFLSTWRCPVASGQLVDRNVLTVVNATSYQDDNEIRSGEHSSRSTVLARRIGECPPAMLTPH